MNISKQQLQNAVDNTTPEFLHQFNEILTSVIPLLETEEGAEITNELDVYQKQYTDTLIIMVLVHHLLDELEK